MRDDTLEQHHQSVAFSFSFLLYNTCQCYSCGIGERCFFPFSQTESSDGSKGWARYDSSESTAQRDCGRMRVIQFR
jgi:hypothetical protein